MLCIISVAYDISAQMEYTSASLSDAVSHTVMTKLPEDMGGVIAVDPAGHIVSMFNCSGMFRAKAWSLGGGGDEKEEAEGVSMTVSIWEEEIKVIA